MAENVIELTDATFDEIAHNSDVPVLIDFWAPWCGPCKMMAPIVEELAGEYADKAKICKLNTDENQETAIKYGIRGIPTLGIFKNGEMVDTIVGVVPKGTIKDKLIYHASTNA